MTWRGDPIWLADVLRAAGLEVREIEGWRTRGHGDFGEIWGVMLHHTGDQSGRGDNPGYIARHPALGLASQLHLNRAGVWTICGVGIANHAGVGAYPGIPANNGNRVLIGVEAENSGTEGWAPAQYDSYMRGVAAILRRLGRNSTRAIGHKEYAGAAQGKWDPGGMDMAKARADIQRYIDAGGGTPPPQRGEGTVWGNTFQNFKKMTVSYGTAIFYVDKLVNEIWDQVARGWAQLGHNSKGDPLTLVDAIAVTKNDVAEVKADVAEIKRLLAERES